MPVEIPLSRGRVALVDEQDAPEILRYTWTLLIAKCGRESADRSLPRNARANGTAIPMHRQIMGLPPRHILVDHWDGNGLNNQRGNLRLVSPHQNNTNQKARSRISRFKGVYLHRRTNRWYASIVMNGKQVSINGARSDDDVEVALIYDAFAREHYGQFGTYNFPLPGERSALTGLIEPYPSESEDAA